MNLNFETNFSKDMEQQELIQKLVDHGLGPFVETLLNEHIYTRRGRLNKSGAVRLLGCKPKEFEALLQTCKEILRDEAPEE